MTLESHRPQHDDLCLRRDNWTHRTTWLKSLFLSLVATIALLVVSTTAGAGPNCVQGESGACAACPLRFDGDTIGLPATCLFVGRYNDSCGQNAVAVFAGDGRAMVVGIAVGQTTPVVYLPGQVLSGTRGKIVRWRPDLHLSTADPEGSVSLENDGRTLHVRMPTGTFHVDGCPFSDFVGRFIDMIAAPEDARPPVKSVSKREA
jgi:hypothetical protein